MIKFALVLVGLCGLCSGDVVVTPRYTPPQVVLVPRQTSSCKGVTFAFTAVNQQATLTSQNYAGNYPSNLDCTYFISSPAGTAISVTCSDFNVPCATDQMYMSLSGSSTFSDAAGFCGAGQFTQVSSGNKLNLGLQSGVSTATRRYTCKFTSVAATAPATTAAPVTSAPVTSAPGSCTCGNKFPTSRIVGGTAASAGEFPWRVLVFVYDGATGSGGLCGGTIISPNWVLTAAHCTMDFKAGYKINIYYNSTGNPVTTANSGATMIPYDRYVQHPAYNRNTMDNDVTLVHLSRPITFGKNVQAACLPYNYVAETFAGKSITAAGWGTTKPVPINQENTDTPSTTLQKVDLPIMTTTDCRQYYGVSGITDNMICTYLPGKDTCQGDSGGSIDYQGTNGLNYVVGVTSFGAGCAQTSYPGVYAKVSNYLPWIETTTAESFCKPAA